MTARVVVVGSYNQDFVWVTERFNAPGETQLGRFSTGPGGKGSNQAIAAARQGAEVVLIGALGRDAMGDIAAALAERERIDARWERHDGIATGSAAILIDGSGQNMIVVGAGANAALTVTHVEAQRDAIAGARVLLTQHEVNPVATRRALELAGAAGVLRVHNPAPATARAAAAPLALIDVLTPNETELVHLLSLECDTTVAADAITTLDDTTLHALCSRLPVPTIVVTLGAAGAFVSRADEAAGYRVGAERAKVLDTTGAGDAFSGGLAAALAEGMALVAAARHANCVAALKVERAGAAAAMPTREEVRMRCGG